MFRRLKVPEGQRHRVLTWGILGALVLRGGMIVGGVKLLAWWHPVVYAFGAFLAYSGVRTLLVREEDGDELPNQRWVRALRRWLPIAPRFEGSRFFVADRAGGRCGTMLLFALIVIELTDVMFAVDSIPAVLGVTGDLQIVFSSNVLAVLGLRALYSVVEKVVAKLRFLRYGIAAISHPRRRQDVPRPRRARAAAVGPGADGRHPRGDGDRVARGHATAASHGANAAFARSAWSARRSRFLARASERRQEAEVDVGRRERLARRARPHEVVVERAERRSSAAAPAPAGRRGARA